MTTDRILLTRRSSLTMFVETILRNSCHDDNDDDDDDDNNNNNNNNSNNNNNNSNNKIRTK